MAKIVAELDGFVDDWTKNSPQNPDWGMRLSVPHSKKDGEKWVTVSYTNLTVKSAYDVEIDFTQFKKGDHVSITGNILTEISGEYKNLVIKATSVEIIPAQNAKPALEAF